MNPINEFYYKYRDENHAFNVADAIKYDTNCAILIQNFKFWIKQNARNKMNYREGRYWTYNSRRALAEHFPYLSEDQIKRTLKKLIDRKVLIKGCFNAKGYDRTSWYSFHDEERFLGYKPEPPHHLSDYGVKPPNESDSGFEALSTPESPYEEKEKSSETGSDPHWAESPNPLGGITQPIPDTYPDTDLVIKEKEINKEKEIPVETEMLHLWDEIVLEGKIKSKPTNYRIETLSDILNKYFDNDVNEWESYCNKIASSKFLMGEVDNSTFKVNLKWAINEENIEKVLSGEFYNLGEREVRIYKYGEKQKQFIDKLERDCVNCIKSKSPHFIGYIKNSFIFRCKYLAEGLKMQKLCKSENDLSNPVVMERYLDFKAEIFEKAGIEEELFADEIFEQSDDNEYNL